VLSLRMILGRGPIPQKPKPGEKEKQLEDEGLTLK